MPRVVHFEIHAKDAERAIGFWERTFGWSFEKWDGPHDYWIIRTGEGGDEQGIDGGMAIRHGPLPRDSEPLNGSVCTLGVDSVDLALEHVLDAGGRITVNKMPIDRVGWLAYFRDTEGNLFGVMEKDRSVRQPGGPGGAGAGGTG